MLKRDSYYGPIRTRSRAAPQSARQGRCADWLLGLFSVSRSRLIRTGGANGIGAATVGVFHKRGALVVFGDLDSASGEKVSSQYDGKKVQFLRTDVTKYEDNLALFRLALKTYGRVDHAMGIAGIMEQRNIFDSGLTIEDVEQVLSYNRETRG